MQIHRVRGRDLRDALSRAGSQFGESALFLSHETLPDGDVLVAVADPVRTLVTRGELPRVAPARPSGLDDVERALVRSGSSRALIEATLAHVERSGARGAYALDAAAQFLGERVLIAPGPRLPARSAGESAGACVLAFVGPTGVGKTTTLAKIAARMSRVGRRVALVGMDTQRPGAQQQLATIAASIGAPFEAAADGAQLARQIARLADRECVLVDTTGRSPRDAQALERLARALEHGAARLSTYLVVSAASSAPALQEAVRAFAPARPAAWIVTKLDETRAPAGALEAAAGASMGLAFLCDGSALDAHLERASPERIADLLLRGRLA